MSEYADLKLPATGAGGFAALALSQQLWILAATFIVVFFAALLLRKYWRHDKKINQK